MLKPKVKVCMITYNHELFIEEAIVGVLSQDTSFDVELVIGEDCSTDKTRVICEQFASKWPDRVKLLPPEENLGIQDNFFRTLDACSDADYVAICEGDDKWIENNKLAHQIEFLENNNNFFAHAHNVIHRDLRDDTDRDFGEVVDKRLSKEEMFTHWPFHAVSLVVRGGVLKTIPVEILPKFISGDRFLNRWLSCHGDLYYEGSKFFAVYHRHPYGASSTSNYLDLRYQEIDMLDFFETYECVRELCIKQKIRAMRDVALFWSERYGEKKHKAIKFAMEYMKLTSLKSRSDYYYLLLILFGRVFLLSHRRIMKILKY